MPDQSISVLIVEDHEFTRMGLKLSLEQISGLSVIGEAADGEAAVKKVVELSPDVVLMDIELPVFDGIEATRRIKEQLPEIKVIMLTSHNSDQDIFAALGAGANGYCLKNITGAQLASVIRTVSEGAAWLDPGIANRVLSAYSNPEQVTVAASPKAKAGSQTLSPRETEVLRLVAGGLSNQQIAERLGIGLETIKTHMRHIMEKLTVSDRTEAAVKAMRAGLV